MEDDLSYLRHIALVVPALKPDRRLVDLLTRLRDTGVGEIILVNDGSESGYDDVFDAARDLLGCRVITHPENLGKGRALKSAFRFCLESLPEISDVVTCDADGQHSVEDVIALAHRLVALREADTRAVVWGSRDFDRAGIPWKSRLGNRSMTTLVRVVVGHRIDDTQTGLRGFPRELLSRLIDVEGDRFDYEMNVLLMLLDHGIEIVELPISTIYLDAENSQSHFRPVRDSLHIMVRPIRFSISSLAGAAIDLALYALLVNVVFGSRPGGSQIVACAIAARTVSSLVNFTLNRDWVFGRHSSWVVALARYYALVAGILIVSATGTVLLAKLFGGHSVWAKMVVDTVLFIVSYEIQRGWVFGRSLARRRTPDDRDLGESA